MCRRSNNRKFMIHNFVFSNTGSDNTSDRRPVQPWKSWHPEPARHKKNQTMERKNTTEFLGNTIYRSIDLSIFQKQPEREWLNNTLNQT